MTTRLFHISDVHFGIEDRAALREIEEAVANERPDALICTGDLTQRAKHSEYAKAKTWFASLGVPVILDPGNHDMPYYNLWERFTDPYRRYNRLSAAIATKLRSDDVVLVPLKTTVRSQGRFPWSDGVVTPSSLGRTVRMLKELRGDPRTRIVTAHHPLLGPKSSESNPTIGGNKAFAALAEAGAHAALSGHIHTPIDEVREVDGHAMRMIGSGTVSKRLRHGAPPSWQVITCEPGGGIDVERRIAGTVPEAGTD